MRRHLFERFTEVLDQFLEIRFFGLLLLYAVVPDAVIETRRVAASACAAASAAGTPRRLFQARVV